MDALVALVDSLKGWEALPTQPRCSAGAVNPLPMLSDLEYCNGSGEALLSAKAEDRSHTFGAQFVNWKSSVRGCVIMSAAIFWRR